ncbi:hypothetical protein N0V82_007382 [Gnomoniopsis sp. IMI 355080]|nr:hypothetical protein N0V82_007382 [Gnomoniopsis sp. IMI 355080]
MARTRNTVSKTAHLLRSGRQVDISSGLAATVASSSNSSKTNKRPDKPPAKKKKSVRFSGCNEIRRFDGTADEEAGLDEEDSSDEKSNDEDFDGMESEGDDSEDYYPTKIAKKREADRVDNGKNVNSRASQGLQRANSKVTHKTPHRSSNHGKASTSNSASFPTSEPVNKPCTECSNAHSKCIQSRLPGQSCKRCAERGLSCVVDPNHSRTRHPGGKRSQGKTAKGAKTITAEELEEEDLDDSSSDDPLNNPVSMQRSASRKNNNTTATRSSTPTLPKLRSSSSTTQSGRSITKPHHENQYCPSSSSSPPSPAPDSSEDDYYDELESTMAGAKKTNKEVLGASISTPNPGSKRRTTKAAARKGPARGISGIASNGQQQQSHPSSPPARQSKPIDDVPMLEQQSTLPTDFLFSPSSIQQLDTSKGKDQTDLAMQHKENAASNTSPVDRVDKPDPPALKYYYAHPTPVSLFPAQHTEDFTSIVPPSGGGETKSVPTFLPKGHGSVLNSDSDDVDPLPPISQIGQGGAYIGRYDAQLATEQLITTTSTNNNTNNNNTTQVPAALRAPPPPTTTGYDLPPGSHPNPSILHQGPTFSPTTTTSSTNDMPAQGTPAYRYSATKILFLLKQVQRAQLLALGGAHIAPETVAQLDAEIEGARQRAIALWHVVHDHVPVGGNMYDVGGLSLFQ